MQQITEDNTNLLKSSAIRPSYKHLLTLLYLSADFVSLAFGTAFRA